MIQDEMKEGICFTECFYPAKLVLEHVYEAAYDSKSNKSVYEGQIAIFLIHRSRTALSGNR